MGDAVASVVERVLMNISITVHHRVGEILHAHNLTFSDCYQNPAVLNLALKELFENEYIAVVEKIKAELVCLEDNSQRLATFIEKLSE